MKSIVSMSDGDEYVITRLLSPNYKHPPGGRYRSVGLTLTALATGRSGRNLCPFATRGCATACYAFSSRLAWPTNRRVGIARTRLMTTNPAAFREMLAADVTRELRAADRAGVTLVCRLNMISDVPFEREFPELFRTFARVQFMDYTKDAGRMLRPGLPPNYHLTFSRSEHNEPDCRRVLSAGGSVAVVFRRLPYPKTFWGFRVIDGEADDYRFLDPRPCVVGLRAKGKAARNDATGFVIDRPTLALPVLTRAAA